jgi:outer membrane protein
MKKLLVILTAVVLTSCTQTKIAYIDVEVLMQDYKATQELEESLKLKQESIAKELDSLQAPFQQKVQQYYENAQNMSAQKRNEIERELQQEQQFLQARGQQATQELQNENQLRSDALTQKVDSLVAVFATEKGYKLILGSSGKGTIMYGDKSLDITNEIVEMLNADFDKE